MQTLFAVCFPVSTLKCALNGHVGSQPLTTDSRSNLTPEGFEPLTKSSWNNSPTNCTLWQPLVPTGLPSQRAGGRRWRANECWAYTVDLNRHTETKGEKQKSRKMEKKISKPVRHFGLGCTLGMGAEKDMDCFHDTGLPSVKVFMLPDKLKVKTTKTMWLKHNLCAGAGKMNIMPNLHSTLISVPNMADYGYIAVFD